MRKSPFVTLIFRGSRFGEAAMPLEALPELAAYRDLVLAVAKALYQGANRDRQRLPKGFETAFRLVLDRVESGSVVPMVSRLSEDPGLLFLPEPDWFDRARDLVEQGIGAASKGAALPAELSNEILARFGAFGRTLAAQPRSRPKSSLSPLSPVAGTTTPAPRTTGRHSAGSRIC